jgi:hypothetical protein
MNQLNLMQIVQIKGVDYVSTRCLESAYNLTRKKAWLKLKELQEKETVEFIEIAQLRFWEYNKVKTFFDNL